MPGGSPLAPWDALASEEETGTSDELGRYLVRFERFWVAPGRASPVAFPADVFFWAVVLMWGAIIYPLSK